MYLRDKKPGGWVPAFSSLFFVWAAFGLPICDRQPSRKATLRRAERMQKGINAQQRTPHTVTLIFLEKSVHQKSNIHKQKKNTRRSLSNVGTHTRARPRAFREREKERKKKNTERSFPLHSFYFRSRQFYARRRRKSTESTEEHGTIKISTSSGIFRFPGKRKRRI